LDNHFFHGFRVYYPSNINDLFEQRPHCTLHTVRRWAQSTRDDRRPSTEVFLNTSPIYLRSSICPALASHGIRRAQYVRKTWKHNTKLVPRYVPRDRHLSVLGTYTTSARYGIPSAQSDRDTVTNTAYPNRVPNRRYTPRPQSLSRRDPGGGQGQVQPQNLFRCGSRKWDQGMRWVSLFLRW
jgi:hypothetical protein